MVQLNYFVVVREYWLNIVPIVSKYRIHSYEILPQYGGVDILTLKNLEYGKLIRPISVQNFCFR